MANVDLGQMQIDHVDAINNADSICLVAYLDMGLMQLSKCPSASRNDIQRADLEIMMGWIDVFEQNFLHFAAQPELYMPKAHPKPKALPKPPVVNIIQNPAIQHQMYEMSHMRTELLHSEDAERLNGYHSKTTEVVITPWIAKFKAYNTQLAENIDPQNAQRTFMPDADLQEPGVNPGEPR